MRGRKRERERKGRKKGRDRKGGEAIFELDMDMIWPRQGMHGKRRILSLGVSLNSTEYQISHDRSVGT